MSPVPRHPIVRLGSLLSVTVALLIAGAAAEAFAQGGDAGKSEPAGQEERSTLTRAPVIIDGETLFAVRGLSAYPAEDRARVIAERIRTLAANRAIASPSVTLDDQPGLTRILGNGILLAVVYDEDAALEAVDRSILAEAYRLRVVAAIEGYRAARQPALLQRHALMAGGATLGLLVAAYGLFRLRRWVRRRVERRYSGVVHDLSFQSLQVIKAEHMWRVFQGALTLLWGILVVALFYAYLRFTLGLFPWTRGLSNGLVTLAVDPLRFLGQQLIAQVPNLVFLAILFLITRFVIRMVRFFFEGVAAGTVKLPNFDAEWAVPTYKLVRTLIVALALVVAYPYVPGSDTDAFRGISIFAGLVFSLGSSSLVGNLIAGYSMTYRRAFRPGDRVRIGEHVGEVVQMRLLATHLRTAKHEEVIVPNSAIVGAEVVNYTSFARSNGLILHTTVGIGYETPWRQVEAMLIEAANRTPGLWQEPPPFVLQTGLGDFCITYEINVYCDTPHLMRKLYADLHRNILDVFNEYGVQIMTPAYEGDPEQPKLVPKENWYTAPAHPPGAREAKS